MRNAVTAVRGVVLAAVVLVLASACATGSPQACGETLHQDGQDTPMYCASPAHAGILLVVGLAAVAVVLAASAARYVCRRRPAQAAPEPAPEPEFELKPEQARIPLDVVAEPDEDILEARLVRTPITSARKAIGR